MLELTTQSILWILLAISLDILSRPLSWSIFSTIRSDKAIHKTTAVKQHFTVPIRTIHVCFIMFIFIFRRWNVLHLSVWIFEVVDNNAIRRLLAGGYYAIILSLNL